jgi:hypothetical protein
VATDAVGTQGLRVIEIPVYPDVTLDIDTLTLPNGNLGTFYDQTIAISSYTAPATFSIDSGALPTGVTLNTGTGRLSGFPTALGSFNFTIGVVDSGSPTKTGNRSYGVDINPAILAFTHAPMPSGESGLFYSYTLTADYGFPAYTFSVTGGTLPTGLSLNASTGVVDGTPTAGGAFVVEFTVTDSDTPTAQTAVRSETINIDAPITVTPLTLPSATTGVGSTTGPLSAVGGVAPYTWAVTSGTLPTGLSISATTGAITGTPSVAGIAGITVTATDSDSPARAGAMGYTIDVRAPVVVTTTE